MARVKGAIMTRKRRKNILKAAKGYWGAKSKHFKMAKQAVLKSGNYAFAGRKMKKRDFRSLWIARISAQAKVCGMNYSTLMHGLKVAGIDLNRKMLAELAVSDKEAFAAICEKAKEKVPLLPLQQVLYFPFEVLHFHLIVVQLVLQDLLFLDFFSFS